MSWITPLGLPVMQPYRKEKSVSVQTKLQSLSLCLDSDTLPVNSRKQCTAVPPNYVHSLDATHMLMTALRMKELNLDFTAVHDSFWTHPCDIPVLSQELRRCFTELYSKDLLQSLKDSLESQYPDIEFPDVPRRGQLDLEKVQQSKYFFH